jgi:hypothetical protein
MSGIKRGLSYITTETGSREKGYVKDEIMRVPVVAS